MPQVFKIGDTLASKYNGAGIALGAVTGGELVGLVYLRDALPDFDEGDGIAAPATPARRASRPTRAKKAPRRSPLDALLNAMHDAHLYQRETSRRQSKGLQP